MEEHSQQPINDDVVEEQVQKPIEDDVIEEQIQRHLSEKKESFIDRIKQGGRIIAEKSAIAKNSVAGKFAKIDAENCTLQEAMAKIEKDVFAGTKILEDLDARFMGSARKLRDQIARKTAKMIYERWNNDQEKEEVKQVIELDYGDV
ncbi:MAG: hypothetical protein WBI57_14915 [Desulfobacterales bacterium]